MSAFASCHGDRRRGQRPGPLLVGALFASAVLLPAADAPSPSALEEVKIDLKALQRGENPQLSGTPAGPSVSVPGFQPAPETATPPLPPALAGSNRRNDRPPASANWLLEAMELQGSRRASARQRENPWQKNEAILVDASDPAYLLKLYLAQEAPRPAPAGAPEPGGDARLGGEIEAGNIDGFLKEWIAPRDLALFGLGEGGRAAFADLLPPADRFPAGAPAPMPTAPAAPNPFLEDLKLEPLAPDLAPAAMPSLSPPPAAVAPAPPKGADTPAARNPPPESAEDRKYFPQLKRF